jgi:hypothetical protein
MATLRRGVAATAIGVSGAAVMTLSWWAVLVVIPCVALAFTLDGLRA